MAAKDQGLGSEESPADVSALGDAPRIRAILIKAARAGRSVSYSELLGDLGFRFTRPKMRARRFDQYRADARRVAERRHIRRAFIAA